MNSISDECTPLKHEYDACFNSWYSEKFLKGVQSNECDELFRVYQSCVKVYNFLDNLQSYQMLIKRFWLVFFV